MARRLMGNLVDIGDVNVRDAGDHLLVVAKGTLIETERWRWRKGLASVLSDLCKKAARQG
jgi:hypothetical protein